MNSTTNLYQSQNKVVVYMGYDHIETNITLAPGHGAILPDPSVVGPYSLVWWNASDYIIPTDDPFVEVVMCIAKIGDTLVVMRSQQQTLASYKNIPNKLYNMIPLPGGNLDVLSYYNVPQVHGISSHTGTIGTWANIDKTTSSIADITTKSHGSLTDGTISGTTNSHAQIDTHIAAVGTSVHSLGTMSTQSAGGVTITAGSITGLTNLTVVSGTPTAPTAVVTTNTTQIATTAFVNTEIANDAPTKTGGGASGSWGISVTGSSASCTGNASTVTTNANLTGDVTSVGNATTLTNAPVIAKVLTGYTSGSGTISATDSILSAIQKLNGNDVLHASTSGTSAHAAASINTASAIVARDASGNFAAGTITATLTGAASLNVLKTGDTMSGTLNLPPNGLVAGTNQLVVSGGNVGIGTASPTSTLHSNGSFSLPIVNKTGAYTATSSDHTITCNATSATFTITLPTASGITGRMYVIKKMDSSGNAITIDANASETIDGSLTRSLNLQYESITIQSDGTNWYIL
jgi:hypothetical protein